jgi:hypothetical protein
MKMIKDISIGDLVYTHKGRYQKVKKVYKRAYEGKIIYIVEKLVLIKRIEDVRIPILNIINLNGYKQKILEKAMFLFFPDLIIIRKILEKLSSANI